MDILTATGASRSRRPGRSRLATLHRWSGLALFAILLLQCLTGSLLLFEEEIDGLWLEAAPADAVPAPRVLGLDALARSAAGGLVGQGNATALRVKRINLGSRPGRPARVRLMAGNRAETEIERFVDPVSGAVLGERGHKTLGWSLRYLMPLADGLHSKLLAGDVGKTLLGIAAVLWMVTGSLGIVLSLPPARGIAGWCHAWRLRGMHNSFQLHRGGGLWLSAVAMLFGATAFLLAFEDALFSDPAVTPAQHSPGEAPRGFVAAAGAARALLPPGGRDYRITEVRHESGKGRYRVDLAHAPTDGFWHWPEERLYVAAQDGALLGRDGWMTASGAVHLKLLALPLHTGAVFGAPGRILALAMALCLAAQIGAGIRFWWRRRHRGTKKRRPSHGNRLPEAGLRPAGDPGRR